MGGMETWVWAETFPGFMDAAVPMASQPTEMSARNWMTRRIMIESIRQDPAWNNGDYTTQPPSLRLANVFFGIATSGGTLGYQALAPTREKADALVDSRSGRAAAEGRERLHLAVRCLARLQSVAGAGTHRARVLAINSADDERNPPQTGLMDQALQRIADARLFLIPASAATRGHGTTGMAKFGAPNWPRSWRRRAARRREVKIRGPADGRP